MRIENVMIVFILIGVIFVSGLGYTGRTSMEIVVKDKVVKSSNKVDKYLIFTDKGVLENTDLWFIGKFNSSDLYSQIEIGHKYKVEVVGVRIPIFSQYKNIVKIEEVEWNAIESYYNSK